jgi:hypothetical protein
LCHKPLFRAARTPGEEVAEAMVGWWEEIGIKAKRVPSQYAAFRAQLLADGFSRPTVMGVWQLSTNAVSGARIGARHDIGAGFANTNDPTLQDLDHTWQAVGSVEEYIEAGRAYQRELYEQVGTSVLVLNGEVFGASSKVPSELESPRPPVLLQPRRGWGLHQVGLRLLCEANGAGKLKRPAPFLFLEFPLPGIRLRLKP